MVTTHLRARAAQAGALLAVVLGGLVVAPAVAFADAPDVSIQVQRDVLSGGRLTMTVTVANTNNPAPIPVNGQISVSGGMDCGNDCTKSGPVDSDGTQFTVSLTAPQVAAGQTQSATVKVVASVAGEDDRGEATAVIKVKGPDKPQSVRQVSGRVKDQDGRSVAGATVGMQDSAGRTFQTTSDGSGQFSFTSSDSKPISPGTISIGAGKDGFVEASVQRQAQAGRNLSVSLTLKARVTASPSASATPSASPSAVPTEEVSEEATTPEETEATDQDTNNAAATEEDSGGSMLYIIIGVLLVAAGIGAIVLVVLRRRNSDNGDDDPTGRGGPGGSVPPSRGGYSDATRVGGAPVGGARNDATMIAPRSGAPSMSDAPTMIHRPAVDDEFPDPYGVPAPQPGTFAGAPAGGWDDQANQYGAGTQPYGAAAGGQYGEATSYGRGPADDQAGYAGAGAPAGGGYGTYSEPTGMYRPEADAAAGYDQGGGQYGAGTQQYGGAQYGPDQAAEGYQAGGYGQQPADPGGYGSWESAADGLDNNGYGPQGGAQYGGASYGADQGGGQYGGGTQPYAAGDYDQGYQAEQRGGYDSYQGGGYADQPGYEEQQPPQHGNQGQRGGGTYGGGPRQDPPGQRRGGHDY